LTIDQATACGVTTLGVIDEFVANTFKGLVSQTIGDVGWCVRAVAGCGWIYFLGAEIGVGHIVGRVSFDFEQVGSLSLDLSGYLGHHACIASAVELFGTP